MKQARSPIGERPLRIAFVTAAWVEGGGLERVLFTLLAGLDRQRFRPVVFTLFASDVGPSLSDAAEALGIPVVRLSMTPGWDFVFARDAVRLVGELRRGRFQVVHDTGGRGLGVIAGWFAAIPVRIYTANDMLPPKSLGDFWLRRVTVRWAATRVVAVSRAVARSLQATYGVPASRILVVLNGVDDGFLDRGRLPAVAETERTPRPRRILTVARLDNLKGVDVVLEAIALVIVEMPQVELHVAGDGPLRTDLETQAARLGIASHVTFHGQVSGLAPLFAAADVLVLASRREGLGVSVIEAMAASLPVVVSSAGGLPEVVSNGESGIVITPRRTPLGVLELDPADFANALLRLFRDPQLAHSMGRAGRRRYEEHFAATVFVDQYQALYESLASEGRHCNEL